MSRGEWAVRGGLSSEGPADHALAVVSRMGGFPPKTSAEPAVLSLAVGVAMGGFCAPPTVPGSAVEWEVGWGLTSTNGRDSRKRVPCRPLKMDA